ncbi:hypothetical protein ACOMHN_002243 [Nucella lapillus]
MFNLPVISSSSRHSPDSSGMMHLNALNGSCHNDHNDTPSIHGATPPSYEDAFQSAPLFGLFSMNGVDGSHSTPHHHQYHHHHPFHNLHSQPSQNFPASSSHGLKGVRDSSPGSQVSCSLPSVSVSYASPSPNPSHSHARGSEHRSPGGDVTTGSDVTKSAANERPVSRGFRSREEGGTRFVGERFEMEEQCGRLSRISVVSNNSMMPVTFTGGRRVARVGNLLPPHCLTRVEHGKGFSDTSTREDHPPLASRGNFVPPQDVAGVQHGNGFSETTTRSAILQLTSTGNLLPPHREARMQHGVNHTVTSTLGGLLSPAHRLAQVHQRMTSTRGPRPGSEWTNLPPPLHLTDGRHGIFGVTSTRKGHLPLREAPFLAWKGVRAGALLPPPLPLAVVRHRSASFRVMSTLGGGALPFRRQLVDVQMEASIAVTAMTGALLPPPPSRLAHGALRAGLSVTSTQGRVAGTPLVTLHWLSGAHQRDEARTHCVVIQTARHVVHAVGQTPADRRDCLTTLETRRASLRQAQRVAEGDNPVNIKFSSARPDCRSLDCGKSPRPGSSARNQSQKDSLAPSRKNGSGNAGWQKHPGKEKSAFTSAKDTLYRVFSPIISRRQDRQNENPAKVAENEHTY